MPDKQTQVVRVNRYLWEGLDYIDTISIKPAEAVVRIGLWVQG